MSDKMPLSEIRRILERGEWWDNVRDVSPDEPCPWMDELNGAIEAALDRLTEYETAEKDGLIVRLPCKMGDIVYFLHGNEIERRRVTAYDIFNKHIEFLLTKTDVYSAYHVSTKEMGKTVFMTREEAEAALKGDGV